MTPIPMGRGGSLADLGLIALFCLIWSSAFAAGKLALPDCPPLILLSSRFLVAGLFLFGLAALVGRPSWPDRRTTASWVVLGALNGALYLGLSYSGMRTVSSAFTAVLISANPLLTALVASPVLGERLSPLKLGGLLLGMIGVGIVLRSRLVGGAEDWHGTLLVLAALVALVGGTILFKKLKPGGDLWTGTAIQSLSAGILLLPLALATESLGDVRLTPALIGGWLYLVVVTSIGGYLLWFRLLRKKTATEASSLHFLMPPLGLFFGWLVFREPVSLVDCLGIIPIAIGIAMVTRG
ncbi:DMT family transporter [Kaistia sp. 32K]|uniref:DMT family transporter n=1 Tax=Kaistia sp. 32K TaxID=2795690 RepID=UPI001FD1C69F|nr:DMT family transporter [Kaistia sp. 32K]